MRETQQCSTVFPFANALHLAVILLQDGEGEKGIKHLSTIPLGKLLFKINWIFQSFILTWINQLRL